MFIPRPGLAMVKAQRLDAGTSGVPESMRVGTIGNHDRNRGVETPVPDGIDECLKIAPAPGDENAQSAIHGRLM